MDRKFLIIIFVFLFINIAVVSANDSNSTDILQEDCNDTSELKEVADSVESSSDTNATENETIEKTTPSIKVGSKSVKSKSSLEITLANSKGKPLKDKKLTATINNKKHSIKTNSKGIAKLSINLPAKSYNLKITFDGDDEYNKISKTFKIKVLKLKTKFAESGNFVIKGNYLYFYLFDNNGNPVSSKKITLKFNGKTHNKKSNSKGRVGLKIKNSNSKYSIKVKFKGDKQYKGTSKTLKFYVTSSRSIKIENTKVLTKGFIRVYLKVNGKPVSKKVTLTIGGKKLSKKANSEGIAVFKPKVKAGHYTVKAKAGKYYSSRHMKCYDMNVRDPLKEAIPTKNGAPDLDFMPGTYVTGDGNAKYTLTKKQYREVLLRDSYCLFLNNKLTKYTFFKTKSHPKLNHIIKREKWNVIERAINTKLVKKNKNGYWPGKIPVSLKGKSYKYPFVRDVQNVGNTCGPTSASMCTQALKNYVCESRIAKLADTQRWGTSCANMIKALEKNNYEATYFYKSTFSDALKELKNGGTALIFHANKHYLSILDISKNGKKVLVSNSFGTYDNVPTGWVKVSKMKNKFSPQWSESLIVKLNYGLSNSKINSINSYYASMGKNWVAQNDHASIGRT